MIRSTDFERKVALMLPLYLRTTRHLLQTTAKQQRSAAETAWPSLRQANWLAEVAARATKVEDIIGHLQKQGVRWAESSLAEQIEKEIGDGLREKVVQAMKDAAKKVGQTLPQEPVAPFRPDYAWVAQEQLILARFYIGALVTWRRIDESAKEAQS